MTTTTRVNNVNNSNVMVTEAPSKSCCCCCCPDGFCSKLPTFSFCCFKFPLRTGCFILGTFRILLWILCIVLACYHHLNTELESGPDSFVALVAVVAFPIAMFVFDSLMLVTVFMRKAKPLLIWLYFNILANAFPYVVLFNDDFDDVDLVVERLIFCALFTFPSVYAILVVFSYYRELSQSRGLILSDPRLAGSEFWYYPGSAMASNQSVEVYMASHYPPSLQNSKFYYV